jgi:exodeoxyribonuclease-3
MKLISWNVNGIRSASRKGLLEWLSREAPDVLCLQEIKAQTSDVDELMLSPLGYKSYWHSAKKRGYSGVATYVKSGVNTEPKSIIYGLGNEEFDNEGRVLVTEFQDFTLINAYFPNSQRDGVRLGYKLAFCKSMLDYCDALLKRGQNVVICGDFNIAHKEIDLRNPKQNVGTAGFLPEERAWLDLFVERGYVDAFRLFSQEPFQYTWWSYRPTIRERNIGWRIDYHFVSKNFAKQVKKSLILAGVLGSDHCPVMIELIK